MPDYTSEPRSVGALRVAELARLAEVTPATVRYYSRVGLLHPQREPDNGYRRFSASDQHRVSFIRRAQSLGLTIGDIKLVLETIDHGEEPCRLVRSLVEGRLRRIRKRLAELQATEARIVRALASWEEMKDDVPGGGELCPLIERATSDGHTPLNGTERHRQEQQRVPPVTTVNGFAVSA